MQIPINLSGGYVKDVDASGEHSLIDETVAADARNVQDEEGEGIMDETSYYDFEFKEDIGFVLQLLNFNLFIFALCVLKDKCQNMTEEQSSVELRRVLSKTNGEIVKEIVKDLNITDKEVVEFLNEGIELRNLLCHAYPVRDEYWCFSKDGKGLEILSKEEFKAKISDAMTKALTLHMFIKNLYEGDFNE